MKIKNIILTLCCITLGLVLNIGTAFAEIELAEGVEKYHDGWLKYTYDNTTYYVTETKYQELTKSFGSPQTPNALVGQHQCTNTSTIKPGTSTSHLSEGVLNMYNGFVKIDPSVFYDANAGDSNLNYLKDAAIMYMDMDTYKQLSAAFGDNLNAKTILDNDSYSARTITEAAYKEISNIIEEGFATLAKLSYDQGQIEFSSTAPSLSDLADSAMGNYIYFYCDVGSSHQGEYGRAENYRALYMYIKDTAGEYSADFDNDEIDSSDMIDCLPFSIESSTANICSVSTMMGVVKDTLIFTEGEINVVNGLLPTIIPIAYCLMVLYFVLEIANIASRDITNISAEIYIKAFAKLIIAVLIIGNSYKIIVYGANLANGLTDMLLTAATGDLSLPQLSEFVQNAARADSDSFLTAIKGMLSLLSALVNLLLIPFNFVVVIILSVQCYSRKIEFLIRSLFLPMAIADIAGKGLESGGMRYLRKLVAVGFQGGGIIALTFVAGKLQVVSNSGTDIIIVIALLGSIGLVKAAINEMMGV